MLIGLSIRFCIKDILLGDIDENDVRYIISNTVCTSEESWAEIEKECLRLHWGGDTKGSMILKRLREAGKIIQPRLVDPNFMTDLHRGRWFVNTFERNPKDEFESAKVGFSWAYGGLRRSGAHGSVSAASAGL